MMIGTGHPWRCENGHVFGDGHYGQCPECQTLRTMPMSLIRWRAADYDDEEKDR